MSQHHYSPRSPSPISETEQITNAIKAFCKLRVVTKRVKRKDSQMLRQFSKFVTQNNSLSKRCSLAKDKVMLEQRRMVLGAKELSSESENSDDDKMLSQFIREADANMARKFEKYIENKAKVWHQNH